MFLRIGDSIYNQDSITKILIDVRKKEESVAVTQLERIRDCLSDDCIRVDKTFYYVHIVILYSECREEYNIYGTKNQDCELVSKTAERMRTSLIEVFGTKNICLNLDTGEIYCYELN